MTALEAFETLSDEDKVELFDKGKTRQMRQVLPIIEKVPDDDGRKALLNFCHDGLPKAERQALHTSATVARNRIKASA